MDRLRDEISSLQTKLSEVSSTAIEQGERLREARRAKRELDGENNDLKTVLKNAQVSMKENTIMRDLRHHHMMMCKFGP